MVFALARHPLTFFSPAHDLAGAKEAEDRLYRQRKGGEPVRVMLQWLPQSPELASRSYDLELKALTKGGQMTDAELENIMGRLADIKRPRQAAAEGGVKLDRKGRPSNLARSEDA